MYNQGGLFSDFRNAFNKPNNALPQIIIINIVVYLVLGTVFVFSAIGGFENFFYAVHDQFTIPPIFSEFLTRPWTLITYAFTHDLSGILHILFNMLVLYWFGKLVVEFLGNNRFISLYFLGAITGGISYLLVYNLVPYYIERSGNFPGMVGASAAVYAVVLGAATNMPNYTFFLLFLGPVRIKYIAAAWVVLSFLGSAGSNAGGNIAHLGGALIGYLYIVQLKRGHDIGAWILVIGRFLKSFFVKQPKIKVTYSSGQQKPKSSTKKSTRQSSSVSNPEQEEIDAILDKISQSGYESLTKEEKQKLFNASKR